MDSCYHPKTCNCVSDCQCDSGYECCSERPPKGQNPKLGLCVKNGTCDSKLGLCNPEGVFKTAGKITEDFTFFNSREGFNDKDKNWLLIFLSILLIVVVLFIGYKMVRK